jgi:hypothetical protein
MQATQRAAAQQRAAARALTGAGAGAAALRRALVVAPGLGVAGCSGGSYSWGQSQSHVEAVVLLPPTIRAQQVGLPRGP